MPALSKFSCSQASFAGLYSLAKRDITESNNIEENNVFSFISISNIKNKTAQNHLIKSGISAGEGSRTHTHEAPDPKSGLSTNFNTPAGLPLRKSCNTSPIANAYLLEAVRICDRKGMQIYH